MRHSKYGTRAQQQRAKVQAGAMHQNKAPNPPKQRPCQDDTRLMEASTYDAHAFDAYVYVEYAYVAYAYVAYANVAYAYVAYANVAYANDAYQLSKTHTE